MTTESKRMVWKKTGPKAYTGQLKQDTILVVYSGEGLPMWQVIRNSRLVCGSSSLPAAKRMAEHELRGL